MMRSTLRATVMSCCMGSLFLILHSQVLACFAAPMEEAWGKSSEGQFEYRRMNRTGELTVYAAKDKATPLWQVKVPEFSALFSQIFLSDCGQIMIHVRGNYMMSKLDDTAVHVFKNDGTFCRIPAKAFIDTFVVQEPTPHISISPPRYSWLARVKEVKTDSFTILNAKNEEKTVLLNSLKMEALAKGK